MNEAASFFDLRRRWPALVAWLFCVLYMAALVASIRARTGGLFVYPLDDSYIHLALARTLAVDHVWGMGPYEFASASSSPGWTLILAGLDVVAGAHLATPIFVNLLLALCLLVAMDGFVEMFAPAAPVWIRAAVLFAVVLGTPLPNLILLGMEHVAQALSIFLLVAAASVVLSVVRPTRVPRWAAVLLLGAGALAGCIRYEAVFAVAPILALLAWRRRFGLAGMLAVCAALGPVGFGLYSHAVCGLWLPFSVVAKAAMGGGATVWVRARTLVTWKGGVPVLWTLLPLWLLRLRARGVWERTQLLLLLSLGVGAAHLLFAPLGWLLRYESYFVALCLYALWMGVGQARWPKFAAMPPADRVLAAIAVCGMLSLAVSLPFRLWVGTVVTVRAAVDRYNEHILMARFVAAHYDRDTIVVDDIGAVAFYTHAHLLDIIGLGSGEPLFVPRREHHAFAADDVARWAAGDHASIAILQSGGHGVRSLTPAAWQLLQTWHMDRNVLFEDRDISFYAVRPEEVGRLCASLRGFSLSAADRITVDACGR